MKRSMQRININFFVVAVFLLSGSNCQSDHQQCQPDGSIRLVGGSGAFEGNVQLCMGGTWGYVCDNSWDINEATVVCRQLGYNTTSSLANYYTSVKSNSYFGSGNGIVYLDSLYCSDGIHQNLTSCPHGNITCDPYADIAGVICSGGEYCTNGDIRSIDTSDYYGRSEGRVEICNNNQWGGVCRDSWSSENSQVVCRQLEYNSNYSKTSPDGFNDGSIAFTSIQCNGTESNLSTCNKSVSSAPASCPQCQGVGVRCYSCDNSTCTEGSIKLWSAYNNTPSNEGIVLICRSNRWYAMCDVISKDNRDEDYKGDCHIGRIACRSMGYDGAIAIRSNAGLYYGYYYYNDEYRYFCYGSQNTMDQCSAYHNNEDCGNYDNALGVICANDTTVMKECTDGDVRLVNGGSTVNRGRVEYCYKGQWSPMCSLDTTTAQLLCKRLGYDNSKVALIDYRESFGASNVKSAFHHFKCSYWHSNLSQCSISTNSAFECYARDTCYKEYGLTCDCTSNECISSECNNHGDIRLVGGSGDYEGNVQLCVNGTWGYICDDGWYSTFANTAVICEQLGFTSSNVTTTRRSYFGTSNGIIHFDNVYCSSYNLELIDCSHGVTYARCDPLMNAAGVRCISAVGGGCNNGDSRLVSFNGLTGSRSEGRVEVCINNQWGTVCAANSWTNHNTKVVCRQLGYSDEYFEKLIYSNEKGYIPISLRNVQCNGNESNLLSCNQSADSSCTHIQDVGIRCYSYDDSLCSNGDYRLWSAYDTTSINEGLLHVCINNTWYPVADTSQCFIQKIACRSLGYDGAIAAIKNAGMLYGRYHQSHQVSYYCDEYDYVDQCYLVSEFSAFRALGVICANDTLTDLYRECTDSDVRLVNGPSVRSGRAQYCYEGQWAPMCSLDIATAQFVCKELGFKDYNYVSIDNQETYGVSSIRSRFDHLSCGFNSSQCTIHSKESFNTDECLLFSQGSTCNIEVGLTCIELSDHTETCTTNGDIRLADGLIEQEGRAEVCVEGVWGSICDESAFSLGEPEAEVFCRTLGYNGSNPVVYNGAYFGQGNGFSVWDRLHCNGSESTLTECSKSVYPLDSIGCTATHTAGVRCKDECADGDVRFVNGSSPYEGTIEVCFNGLWGLIDDYGWSLNNSKVVCSQLGYAGEVVIVRGDSYYGKPDLAIHLTDVQCTGNEESILNCSHTTYCIEEGIKKMYSVEVAGVSCMCATSSSCGGGSVHQSTSSSCSTTNTQLTSSASTTIMASSDTSSNTVTQIITGSVSTGISTSISSISTGMSTNVSTSISVTPYTTSTATTQSTDQIPPVTSSSIITSHSTSLSIVTDNTGLTSSQTSSLATIRTQSSIESSSHSSTSMTYHTSSTINNVTTSDNSPVIGISVGISVFIIILMIVVLASVSVLLVVFKIKKKKRSSYMVSMVNESDSDISDHDSDGSSVDMEETELTDGMTLLK